MTVHSISFNVYTLHYGLTWTGTPILEQIVKICDHNEQPKLLWFSLEKGEKRDEFLAMRISPVVKFNFSLEVTFSLFWKF